MSMTLASENSRGVGKERNLTLVAIGTGYWKNQLRKNSIGCVGTQGIYHPDTESIYYFGGLREDKSNAIFEYHIPSDLWYLDQPQSKFQGRIQGASVLFQKDQALLFGGQTPDDDNDTTSDNNHPSCFYADANMYDFGMSLFMQAQISPMTTTTNVNHCT